MAVLNEAWECLKDDQKRAAYSRLPASMKRPKNSFEYSLSESEPFPDVESFRSTNRKLGLCSILMETSRSEFRTTIETVQDEAMDPSILRKLQNALDNRSDEGNISIPNGTDGWLVEEEEVRYKKTLQLTNGNFILKIDEATEDHFGKSYNGLHISLESYDIWDTLDSLPRAVKGGDTASRLLT